MIFALKNGAKPEFKGACAAFEIFQRRAPEQHPAARHSDLVFTESYNISPY